MGCCSNTIFNPLNAQLIPVCYLLALLEALHILHVTRIRFNNKPCLSYIASHQQHQTHYSVIYAYYSYYRSCWPHNVTRAALCLFAPL